LTWAIVYLVLSVVGLALTLLSFFPGPRAGRVPGLFFMSAWLVGELAPSHIVVQLIVTIVFIALGVLGYWPGWVGLGLTIASWALFVVGIRRAQGTAKVVEAALVKGLGADYRSKIAPDLAATLKEGTGHVWSSPLRFRHPGVERVKDISYGPAGKHNLLDVYRPKGDRSGCPVLVHVHGGAWTQGTKNGQGLPLMLHLAAQGWVCISPNYRLSPAATFPDHLVDVKRVLAWVRAHGAEHGADLHFVAVAGGSAGGHLVALAGLTANEARYQPGFEDADTAVDAVVPLYGAYDLLDSHHVRPDRIQIDFLQQKVLKVPPDQDPEAWERASPTHIANAAAPPFFVVHGYNDSLLFFEDARYFVEALRAVSQRPVVYAELPGGQHAFDTFHSVRALAVVEGVARFLAWTRSTQRARALEVDQ
jgi:acetyl esterase/lipase